MKYYICLIFLFKFCICISQNEDGNKFKIVYANESNLELIVHQRSGFSNEPNNQRPTGFALELNSLHGVYFFNQLALMVGPGIIFNFNEDFRALPFVGQLKFHLFSHERAGPFVLLNAGRNIRLGQFLGGSSAKLGLGYIFDSNKIIRYSIGFFRKTKEFTINEETNFNYQTESLGLSVGIHF